MRLSRRGGGAGAGGADAGAGTDGDVATPARPAPPPPTHCQLMQPIQLSANHYKCNWVEDRIECPAAGTFFFPPEEKIDYKKMKPQSRQPDFRQNKLTSTQGNATEWGLRKHKRYEWKCTDVSDYISTSYEDTFMPPKLHQYLPNRERKARDSLVVILYNVFRGLW
ncbi:unnamed protein product [Chrysodeixis includens]|uniref:Uncharacterized protein n=1 Tax=Chrysodeixis includens TaxID=689277 RepID=A0A9N8PXS0_CHRIL|nr:unnamed protein product [Chrysodeixis includens]